MPTVRCVPPIKCHGIKTKLVPWIREYVKLRSGATWYEPFMGSGVVGFNVLERSYQKISAVFGDINPHIVGFYRMLQHKDLATLFLTYEDIAQYLERRGALLQRRGADEYYDIRDRFNHTFNPLDFLFLNRSCFNGVMRFNNKGEFNVPFCKNPKRFSPAYITRIVHQIEGVEDIFHRHNCTFQCCPFPVTIRKAGRGDVIYCDPPYLGRNTGYSGDWTEDDERELYRELKRTKAKFILSSWEGNKVSQNPLLRSIWGEFRIVTQEHYYRVGPKVENRYPMTEVLVMNF